VLTGWIARKFAGTIEKHEVRIKNLEVESSKKEKCELDIMRVYQTVAKLSDKVNDSVTRFENEHVKTRGVIEKSNSEILKSIEKNGTAKRNDG